MIYECEMVMKMLVKIKAKSEEQALEYIQTHTFEDIEEITSFYHSIDYDDKVISCHEESSDEINDHIIDITH